MRSEAIAVQRTITAQLTPAVPAAIATLAVRGPGARAVVERAFRAASGKTASFELYQARFGRWLLADENIPPEHVVVCRTRDAEFEIHCHGGVAVCRLILNELRQFGCEVLDSGQWPSSEVPGPIEEAAERALQQAPTLKVAAVLLDQYHGCLSRELSSILSLVRGGRLSDATAACENLLSLTAFGMRLSNPWRLAFAGPPNSGKSSLTNALVGSSRVLVHHEPGTTRDAIDAAIVIASWPVIITDTAGVRATHEPVERQGIEAALQRWLDADIGLLVVDATVGWTSVHNQLAAQRSQPTLIVMNKQDLQPECAIVPDILARTRGLALRNGSVQVVSTRATQPEGTAELLVALGEHFDALAPPPRTPVPFLAEQVAMLTEVVRLLCRNQPAQADSVLCAALSERSLGAE